MNWDRIADKGKQFRLIRVTFVASALAVLGGCVAVPVDSGYYAGAPGYYGGYGAPAPAYYPAPDYYGPSFGIEFSGGNRGYSRGYHRGYGYR